MKYIELLRPKHWVKNLFIFIPLFFAGDIFNLQKIFSLTGGFFAFSFVASSIYIMNDYRDIEDDKKHPEKSKRPLASGAVPKTGALLALFTCLAVGLPIAYLLSFKFFFILCIYLALNIGYSFGLKNISILDVIIVSIGFVLRVKGGGTLADVHVSQWLTIMVFLLALFMAFAKRRDDVLLKIASGINMRSAVKGYNLDFLNSVLTLITAISLVAYLMYTLSTEVMERLGTYRLYYTCLFVIAGILRYLQIAYVENDSGSPTGILYKDRFIQATILLWVLSFYFIIYYPKLQLF